MMAHQAANAGYVYGGLERRGIDARVPAKAEPIKSSVLLCRFRYDAKHDIAKCPRGKVLRPGRPIKGNVNRQGEKIYNTPWSPWYDRTQVDQSKGQQWFCDEAEAAGWRPARWR